MNKITYKEKTEKNNEEEYLERKELQQRIDKAIDFIKSIHILGARSGKSLLGMILNNILDILEGEDNEI